MDTTFYCEFCGGDLDTETSIITATKIRSDIQVLHASLIDLIRIIKMMNHLDVCDETLQEAEMTISKGVTMLCKSIVAEY